MFTTLIVIILFLVELRVVNVPPFAESVSEGDVRWEKSEEF